MKYVTNVKLFEIVLKLLKLLKLSINFIIKIFVILIIINRTATHILGKRWGWAVSRSQYANFCHRPFGNRFFT